MAEAVDAPRRFLSPAVVRVVATVVVLVLVAAAGVAWWRSRTPGKELTAYFTQVVGIQPGSDVRILGVRIGEITRVSPQGRTVRVDMRYDAKYKVPVEAIAVIVPPSVVSDRFIQLTPAYTSGAVLPSGAKLQVDRTVVPLELDDVYRTLDELNKALGPEGANKDGALSRLLEAGRRNLQGNGATLNMTLEDLAKALETAANGRQDLFGTVVNLQRFTTALAESDRQVRLFNQNLADVSEQLAGERQALAAALRNLSLALVQVTAFVKRNRDELKSNVDALADVTGILVRQQRAIIQIVEGVPVALSNLALSYNARSGTLDTRDDVLGPYDAATFTCSLLVNTVPAKEIPRACFDLAQALVNLGKPITDELAKLLGPLAPLFRSTKPPVRDGGRETPTTPVVPGLPGLPQGNESHSDDPTLGGILRRGGAR